MAEATEFSDIPLFLWRAENLHKAEGIFLRQSFFAFRYLRHIRGRALTAYKLALYTRRQFRPKVKEYEPNHTWGLR